MSFREYGRTIEKIVEQICGLPDGEKKTEAAKAIVYAMSQVSGVSVKDDAGYRKMWDHLMCMSSFRLECAWTFTAEELEDLKRRAISEGSKPEERLPYRDEVIKSRQYGVNLENMIKSLKSIEDGEEYNYLVTIIAQQAKRDYMTWNGDLQDDKIIVEMMVKLSGDERVRTVLGDNPIAVSSDTLPSENKTGKKKKKKRAKKS